MKKIAVTGGKGGTGKSTVSVLLAKKLMASQKVLLADLDTECPNDHLLTGISLEKPIKETLSKLPEIDTAKCQKCGECVKSCTSNALFMPPGKTPIVLPDLCSACQTCLDVCPHQAITAKDNVTGKIYRHDFGKNLILVTGQARARLIETASVVRQTKETALEIGRKEKVDTIIFDTAAGTHCPVVVAIMGVEKAIAVTEPTPMGAHDLDLILQLLEKIEVPCDIFLNQADLGKKDLITDLVKKFGKQKLSHEIKHSTKLAKAYSRGDLLNDPEVNLQYDGKI